MDRMKAVLSNRVGESDLQPGDHVYSWRSAYAYAHHGIYMGDGSVIHFTRSRNAEIGTNTFLDSFSTSLTPTLNGTCEECGNEPNSSGVITSCLKCFLAEGPLYKFEYGAKVVPFCLKMGGTCTLAQADPPEVVLKRAQHLLINGFGNYHIFRNNCEDFAVYCKTGLLVVQNNGIGRSGQAVSFVASLLSTPLPLVMSNPWGLFATSVGVYYASRYAADIGVRTDVTKVEVEDLMAHIDAPHIS